MKTCACQFSEFISLLGLIVRAEYVEQRGLHQHEIGNSYKSLRLMIQQTVNLLGCMRRNILLYIQNIPRGI
jgi:hypothetical protein